MDQSGVKMPSPGKRKRPSRARKAPAVAVGADAATVGHPAVELAAKPPEPAKRLGRLRGGAGAAEAAVAAEPAGEAAQATVPPAHADHSVAPYETPLDKALRELDQQKLADASKAVPGGGTAPAAAPVAEQQSSQRDGYMQDSVGRLVPTANVKPEHLLEDELVRQLDAGARRMSAALLELKAHAFGEVDAFVELLGQKYGASVGGAKGNMTLSSYDGSLRMQVAVGSLLDFGPELQVAKTLIDDCLDRWTQGGNVNIRTIVNDAFDVGKEGKLRVDRILGLRRLGIDDAVWLRAMEAIGDAVRVTQSKRYVRFYRRASPTSAYEQVALDLSRV